MCQVCGDVAADSTGTAPSGIPANYQQTFFSEASEILSIVDPIVKIKMDNKFFDKTESRQAEADDPGNQGTRDYEDPGVPCLQGGAHAPVADITIAAVPQPRLAGGKVTGE